MDPLSITAGIIALLGTANTAQQALKRLLSIRGANEQLLQTINEVSDLRALLDDVHNILMSDSAFQDKFSTQSSESLPKLILYAQKILEDLEQLVAKCLTTPLHDEDPVKVKKWTWLRTSEKMKPLQESLRQVRNSLSATLSTITSLQVMRVQLTLDSISEISSESPISIGSQSNVSSDDIIARLDEIVALMKTGGATPDRQPALVTNASSDPRTTDISTDGNAILTRRLPLTTQSYVEIQTISEQPPLTRNCQCDCHSISRMKSSSRIDSLCGLLFIGYSGTLSRWSPCKRCPCQKNSDRTANFTYYFPKWFMARVLYIVGSWNPMDGLKLALRMMRIIPDDSLLFHYARQGMISQMQSLFQDRLASPFDVSSKTGRSALHFAVDFSQEEVCLFLLQQGADAHYEDKYFLSAFDIAWEKKVERRKVTAGRAFGLSDQSYDIDLLQKRQLLPIHRVVLGLSKVSLDAQLEISSLEINTADYYGRGPLSWAAGRGDLISTQMLINYGASHAVTDQGGWTVLHHAVRAETPNCIPVLLRAGAAVDAKNNRGNTPLAVSCSYRDSPSHILPLLEAGADPNATMASGLTPLAIAGQHNFARCAKTLLSHGARINYAGRAGLSLPLHASARYNSHSVLCLILESGAATDLRDANGWSLLHHVAISGDIRTMEILYKSQHLFGLNPEQQDNNGLTPKDIFSTLRKGSVNEDKSHNEKSGEAFEKLLEAAEMYTWAKSPISEKSFASTASEVDEWFDSMEKMESSVAELNLPDGEALISL